MSRFNNIILVIKKILFFLLLFHSIPSFADVYVDSLLHKAATSNTDNSSIYLEIINTISNKDSNMHGTTLGLLALELAKKGELEKANQYYHQAKYSIQDSTLLRRLQILLDPEFVKETTDLKNNTSIKSPNNSDYSYSRLLAFLILAIISILTFYVFLIKKEYTVEKEEKKEVIEITETDLPVDNQPESPSYTQIPFFLEELKSNQIDWPQFQILYEKEFPEFINNYRQLNISHTPNNFKHAICIRMSLSLKETASILGVSIGSVKAARNRLKKRLNLTAGDSIKEFILSL